MGRRETALMEWLHEALFRAGIYDYRYPVKGMGIWMPYGFQLRQNVMNIMRRLLNSTGHREVLFPLLIPKDMLEKESAHIKGFMGEVFWVTHGGERKLEVELALRPTSETSMTTAFKNWVQSWKDLPVKVYQIVSVFRYETKATRPLIRVREISTFKEAFTAHATAEEAWEQVMEAIRIYKKFFDELGIPYIVTTRLPWDKFAGAETTVTLDTLMPDGRTLQIGSAHNLGQRFSRVFDAKYMDKDGEYKYIYQTSYGVSERVIASIIAIHGDELGPILPPNVAPIQVVIVPIPYKGREEEVGAYAEKVYKMLRRRRIRVHLDAREEPTPGAKFYEWERRGVPVRIEVGPRDLDRGGVTVVRRDTREKVFTELEQLPGFLRKVFRDMLRDMREKAWKNMRERIVKVESVEDIRKVVGERKVAVAPWCGKDECAASIEEETGFKVLGQPLEPPGDAGEHRCVVCGARARTILYVARSY